MNTSVLPAHPSTAQRLLAFWQHITSVLAGTQADMRLWQAARADHRVMDECVQARQRDLDDTAGLAQSWGRFPEQLPDGRDQATHLRHG